MIAYTANFFQGFFFLLLRQALTSSWYEPIIWEIENTNSASDVMGLEGKSVKFRCTFTQQIQEALEEDYTYHVKWHDVVHNEGEEPTLIFSSLNNTDYKLDLTHPNSADFHIEYDYTLTLNHVSLEEDPGLYFCIITTPNLTKVHAYELSVAEGPVCIGKSKMVEGDKAVLSCSVRNSGRVIPELNWFKEDKRLDSRTRISIRNVTQVLSFQVNHHHHHKKFACQMLFTPRSYEDCHFILEVSFPARAVRIGPSHKYDYLPGEMVTCYAQGNPSPKIYFGKALNISSKASKQTASLQIPEWWKGQQIILSCYASNKIGLKTYSMSKNHTIRVLAKSEAKAKESTMKQDKTSGKMTVMALLIIFAIIVVIIIICLVIKKRNENINKRREACIGGKKPSKL